MSPKTALEEDIRATYKLILQYEESLRLEKDPREQTRLESEIAREEQYVRRRLDEYTRLCQGAGYAMEQDINEFAISRNISLLPPRPPVVTVTQKNEPAITVAKIGKADYRTISEAVQNAAPGTRILVRPASTVRGWCWIKRWRLSGMVRLKRL